MTTGTDWASRPHYRAVAPSGEAWGERSPESAGPGGSPPMVGQFAGHSSYRTDLINWKPSSNRFQWWSLCTCTMLYLYPYMKNREHKTLHIHWRGHFVLLWVRLVIHTLPLTLTLTFSGVFNLAASLCFCCCENVYHSFIKSLNNSNYKVVIYFLTNSFEETEVKLTIFSHYISIHKYR